MKKHELLEKAMRDYPAGTVLVNGATASGVYFVDEEGDVPNLEPTLGPDVINGYVYYRGEWAEKQKVPAHVATYQEIFFRGNQGVGKTTAMELLKDALIEKNKENGEDTLVILSANVCSLNLRIKYSKEFYKHVIVFSDGESGNVSQISGYKERMAARRLHKEKKVNVVFLRSVLTTF